MAKLTSLSLEELYAKEKKTAAVVSAIVAKSDFSTINKQYCDNICKLKCKSPNGVSLLQGHVDILIIEDHKNPPGKFDRHPDQQDEVQEEILSFMCGEAGFRQAGLTFRLVSLLKCRADGKDFPSGKPPTQTTLQKCEPYLLAEIERSKPKVIISLGTATTKSLGLTKHSNTGNRGHIAMTEYGPVVVTLHPRILSYIRQNARGGGGIWGPDYFKVIQRDFEKARDLATGRLNWTPTLLQETVEKLKRDSIKIARSLDDVRDICDTINSLAPNRVVSFDTETTSLDPLDPKLRLLTIQFGWTDEKTGLIVSGVIPLWHRKNNAYNADEAWKILEPILTGGRPKVGHNSKYDILVIYWAKGVRVRNVMFDTLLLQHSIESGTQGCYGLKAACWDHLLELGIAGYEDELGSLSALEKQFEKDSLKEEEQDESALSDE